MISDISWNKHAEIFQQSVFNGDFTHIKDWKTIFEIKYSSQQ